MARSFGVRLLGTALVVISRFYRFKGQVMQSACFPSLPEYRSGLPKRFQATALQRLPPINAGLRKSKTVPPSGLGQG
jgi:hypothetical protein